MVLISTHLICGSVAAHGCPHQHPNFCKDVREYFADISAAIEIITEVDSHSFLLLNGHSTGGLTTPLYAHEGQYKDRVNALFLNSPFWTSTSARQ
ncbi:MAG: alpha/beta hydrolase [Anaerolineae bacterium]